MFLVPSHRLVYPLSTDIERESLPSKLCREYDLYSAKDSSSLLVKAQRALDDADYSNAVIMLEQFVKEASTSSLRWRAALIGWDVANRIGNSALEKYFLGVLSSVPFSWEMRAIARYEQHRKRERLALPYTSERVEDARAHFYIEQLTKEGQTSTSFLPLWREAFHSSEKSRKVHLEDGSSTVSLFSFFHVEDREKEIAKFRSVWGDIFEEDNWFRQYRK